MSKITIAQVKRIGKEFDINVRWDSDWREFRVYYPNAPQGAGTFTDDAEEAIDAICLMHKNRAKWENAK